MNSLFEFFISIPDHLINNDGKIFDYFFWNNFNLISWFKFKYTEIRYVLIL